MSPPLSSLLRYVDHDLMQNTALHDHPPDNNATCPVCSKHWNAGSTFLPLHPCGHWVHYRCLIWLATKTQSDQKDKCFFCSLQLFEWDGTTALTLAIRTDLAMQDVDVRVGGSWYITSRPSDRETYQADCSTIISIVSGYFFQASAPCTKCI
jgi:hypothetical protein